MTHPHRTSVLLTFAVILSMLLAACAGDTGQDPVTDASGDPASVDSFSEVDVTFLQGMVPHHAQAVEMAEMVEGRTGHPEELGGLASQIIATQQEEIDVMNGLLEQAGEDPVDAAMGGMEGMDMDSMSMEMEGMMSAEDMTMLTDAEGDAFDGMFLQMMIAHHEGAIQSAQEVLDQAEGGNADVATLAEGIIAAQETEIEQMQGWQEDWGV